MGANFIAINFYDLILINNFVWLNWIIVEFVFSKVASIM